MSRKEFEFQVICRVPCLKYTVVTITQSPDGPRFDRLYCDWCGDELPQEQLDVAIDQYSQSVFAQRPVRTV